MTKQQAEAVNSLQSLPTLTVQLLMVTLNGAWYVCQANDTGNAAAGESCLVELCGL